MWSALLFLPFFWGWLWRSGLRQSQVAGKVCAGITLAVVVLVPLLFPRVSRVIEVPRGARWFFR